MLSLVLLLSMVISLAAGAISVRADDALIDSTKTGSITVTKYANFNAGANKGTATGTTGDKPTTEAPDAGYTTLAGAEFVLVKIYDTDAVMGYYDGTVDTLVLDTTKLTSTESGWSYNDNAVDAANVKTGTTGSDGTYTFSDLPVGIYILREVTAPNQITTPLAADSLISVPMVNTASSSNNENAAWMYDINVYPKNHESRGSFELTKVDQNGNKLAGVSFKLYRNPLTSEGALSLESFEEVTSTTKDDGTDESLTLVTSTDGKITLANLPAGMYGTQYKLVEESAPTGYIVDATPVYFTVNSDNTMTWNAAENGANGCSNENKSITEHAVSDGPAVTATLRNPIPNIDKLVEVNGSANNWKEWAQYSIGDEIRYKVEVVIPNNIDEISTFTVTDECDYLDYKSIDSVKAGETTVSVTSTIDADKHGFKLDLGKGSANAAAIKDAAGKTLTIIYTAVLNKDAVIAENGNQNTVNLTYSRAANTEVESAGSSTYQIEDYAVVYTYSYQITKYKDSAAAGNEINAVEFRLYSDSACANEVPMVKTADGTYRHAAGTETGVVLVTANGGKLVLNGLEEGDYWLKETKTIDGYNLLSSAFKITVAVDDETGVVDKTNPAFDENGVKIKEDDAAESKYVSDSTHNQGTIVNKKGFVLPQTGSMGYLLFCAAGIIMVLGGSALLFSSRKKTIR